MTTVGMRELKQRASEILRRVRETGEAFEIPYHGNAIARIVPVDDLAEPGNTAESEAAPSPEQLAKFWAEWERASAQISANWPEGVSAAEAVREQRRNL